MAYLSYPSECFTNPTNNLFRTKENAKRQACRTQIPQQRPMRTVARRGPADSEPAVPLARSVVPLPYKHPSPHSSTGVTAPTFSSEDLIRRQEPPPINRTTSSQNGGKDPAATASNQSSENLLQHQPSMVDRIESRPHGLDLGAKASISSSENKQIALLREIQTVCL